MPYFYNSKTLMFKKLKEILFKKQIKKNLKKRDRSQLDGKLRTLAFLVDENVFKNFETFNDIGKSIGVQPKDIKVFSYITVQKKAPSLHSNQTNNRDFSWRGQINNINTTEFLKKPFDVLVGYYNGTHPNLDLMVSKSEARFKVGLGDCDQRLFDLILKVSTREISGFKAEFLKYLKILGKT
ncbi:MAG: DUF6913 domain-containing protein [Marinirhabdus sp.]